MSQSSDNRRPPGRRPARPSPEAPGEAATFAGIDAGASLAKLALGGTDRPPSFSARPPEQLETLLEELRAAGPLRIGVTGCGASRLIPRLPAPAVAVGEFEAWGAGCARMLGTQRPSRHLIVSVGTGTSVLLADGDTIHRVGGTAIGGGTVLGLGHGLLGSRDFGELCRLAEAGDKSRVDLHVGDIYGDGEIPLAQDATASALAKLGLEPVERPDVAAAIMNLVGENIAILCATLSALTQVDDVVFGGTTLGGNPTLVEDLRRTTEVFGRKAHFLPEGGYVGALGALVHAIEGQ